MQCVSAVHFMSHVLPVPAPVPLLCAVLCPHDDQHVRVALRMHLHQAHQFQHLHRFMDMCAGCTVRLAHVDM